jgi:hypothetical protein
MQFLETSLRTVRQRLGHFRVQEVASLFGVSVVVSRSTELEASWVSQRVAELISQDSGSKWINGSKDRILIVG